MTMQEILVAGAGKIGMLVAVLLSSTSDYNVHVLDSIPKSFNLKKTGAPFGNVKHIMLDVANKEALSAYIKQNTITTIISCLPYYCNESLASLAKELNIHYFDLTEDISVSSKIQSISHSATTAFVPQCGLAPGFISIVANDLMKQFSGVNGVSMRVGALPVNPNNALKYSLTWSTDGLINEYGNPCVGIVDGKKVTLQPLRDLETITIDGLVYEAFNTSGGLGTLADTYYGRVDFMNYKTMRYPGHCKKMRFLMNDLRLNEDRSTLKGILENALPKTNQDVVLIYVAVNGYQNDEFIEETYVKKIYPKKIEGKIWSAIQIATAAGICAVVDLVLQNPTPPRGFVMQESISLKEFTENRFGNYYL